MIRRETSGAKEPSTCLGTAPKGKKWLAIQKRLGMAVYRKYGTAGGRKKAVLVKKSDQGLTFVVGACILEIIGSSHMYKIFKNYKYCQTSKASILCLHQVKWVPRVMSGIFIFKGVSCLKKTSPKKTFLMCLLIQAYKRKVAYNQTIDL